MNDTCVTLLTIEFPSLIWPQNSLFTIHTLVSQSRSAMALLLGVWSMDQQPWHDSGAVYK